MANIKVQLDHPIFDGLPVTFKAPCDCTQVSGLSVQYIAGENTATTVFAFADAHGNVLTGIGNLFAAGAMVRVILDITASKAYIQNADTNVYLEDQFAKLDAAKAPAGYGLGDTPKDINGADINSATSNGWYRITGGSITIGGYKASNWYMHVVKYNANYLVQELYTLNGYKLIRTCANGTWTEAWENPPMQRGVEYLTTELWRDNPVYVTSLYFSSLPDSSNTSIELGTGLNVISIEGIAYSNEYVCPIGSCSAIKEVWYQESNGKIYISVQGSTAADYKANVIVKYTKTQTIEPIG